MHAKAYGLLVFILLFKQKATQLVLCNSEINRIRKNVTQKNDIFERKSESICYSKPFPKMTVCPEGFRLYRHLCLWVKDNQPYPLKCPYPHPLSYYSVFYHILDLFPDKDVWLNVFRNTSNGFPEFEWTENAKYSRSFTETIVHSQSGYGKNCITVKGGLYYRVSCSEKHTTVCMYSHGIFTVSRPTKCDTQGYHNCMLANYDLGNQKCYCQKINDARSKKHTFCEKLVEPLPFQTELLALKYKFGSYDKCWIGLHKEECSGNVYKWSSTNESVNYTKWVSYNSCEHSEGAYQFNQDYSKAGWVLLEDETLSCALCELSIVYEKPTLRLRRVKSKGNIQLLITNPNSISRFGRGTLLLDIYCYSDSIKIYFRNYVTVFIRPNEYDEKEPYIIHHIAVIEDLPSHYWCAAFQYPSLDPIVSNVIISSTKTNRYGHEFSLQVTFEVDPELDPILDQNYISVCECIKEAITSMWDHLLTLRPMRGYLPKSNRMDMIIHITTENTHEIASGQQLRLAEIIKDLQTPEMNFSSVFSSEVCLADTTLAIDEEILQWPETQIGSTTIPSNILCLDRSNSMIPVTRDCTGDFLFGGKWAEPKGNCYGKDNYPKITVLLFNLIKANVSAENITEILKHITMQPNSVKVIDVYLIATLLEKVETLAEYSKSISKSCTKIVSNIMNFDRKILKEAQLLLNSTDKILSSLDNILNKENEKSIVSLKLLVEIIEIKDKSIIGLALIKKNFESYKFSVLYKNTSFENLTKDSNLEVVVLLPSFGSQRPSIKLILTVFFNDALFNSPRNYQSDQKIIGVTISDFAGFLKSPLKLFFKSNSHHAVPKYCSFWNYGMDDLMVSKYGHWEEGCLSKPNTSLIQTCEFHHMTHFGLLLKPDQDESSHDDLLRILTFTGSAVSLIGIIPVFVTAIIFKKWRSRAGNIILLNFCTAITLQVILTFASYGISRDGLICKIIGVLFHYSILAEFSWMFVVAILKYRRFVVVFNKPKPRRLLVHLLIGWGMPLLPVVIIASISLENYELNSHKFCYVSGNYLILGLLIPISLILINNLVIFVTIFYAISRANCTDEEKGNNYKLEIFLAILLFFIFGMSWLFGIIGALGGGIWFTYLFCITATIRGFVIFSFFIAGNKETNIMWKNHVKRYIETNTSRIS